MIHRPFGGELPAAPLGHSAYLTDSGRSSLRLILQRGFRDRKFLLPDFLCGVIPKVLEELGAPFGFYHVLPGFGIDEASVRAQAFDALYVIDFFGNCRGEYQQLVGTEQWVIEDCVFLPLVEQRLAHPNWIGFNSLRKATPLADGSLVMSSVPLERELIRAGDAPFAARKYAAKRLKHDFLASGKGGEDAYLGLFAEGERLIDAQTGIFSMSAESLARYPGILASLGAEYGRRRENLGVLRERLGHLEVRLDSEYPSHFVMAVDGRDELRSRLRDRQIFLPSHWPHTHGPRNPLYDRVQAIPLDSCSRQSELAQVADAILELAS